MYRTLNGNLSLQSITSNESSYAVKTADKIRYVETGMKHKSLYCFIAFYKFSVTGLLC